MPLYSNKNYGTKCFDSLAVDVSGRCNLDCVYCYETKKNRAGSSSDINADALFRGIDLFFSDLLADSASTVNFHFGRREPLLIFSFFREVLSYIEQKSAEFSVKPVFHVTTNGTVMTHELARYLKEKHVDLKVSLDGFPHLQDVYRRLPDGGDCYKRVMSGLEILDEVGVPFTVNAVYFPQTSFGALFEFFKSRGIHRVELIPLWISDKQSSRYFRPSCLERMRAEVSEFIDGFIKTALDTGTVLLPRIVVVESYLRFLFGLKSNSFFCSAGRNYICISGDGTFYPCLKFIAYGGWVLGDIRRGVDVDTVERYRTEAAPHITELKGCRDCPIKYGCGGVCFADRLELDGYSRSLDFHCYFQRVFFGAAERLYREFKESCPEFLVQAAGLTLDGVEELLSAT